MPLPLLVTLVACFGPTPEVTSVTPAVAMPGDTVRIEGSGFAEASVGQLVAGDTVVPLPVDVADEAHASTVLPTDLVAGSWTLTIQTPGGRQGAGQVLAVWRIESEPPCDKRYALEVETLRTRREVSIVRHFTDRPATRDIYAGDQLAGLETSSTPTKDGRTCAAIWLRLADGTRVLLADDADHDLATAATTLAGALDLSVTSAGSP